MTNMVKNAVPAYRINNSNGGGSYAEFSGVKVSTNFALDIWYKSSGLDSCLVSQKDGFSAGISGDSVLVRTPSGKLVWIKSAFQKIPSGVWTNLYLGSDGKNITVYLNGYLFGSAACAETLFKNESFLIGTEFSGFVRSVRFYSALLTETAFKAYLLAEKYDAKTMPNTVAFMDLTQENIPDLSGNQVNAKIVNICSLVNTVEVYRPSRGNFAHFADPSPMNIGGFASGDFSLYTKLYIRPVTHTRHIIPCNGTPADSDGVALFADCGEESVTVTVRIGGKDYSFPTALKTYMWADVIVCLKGGKELTVYVNGEKKTASLPAAFKRTGKGDFKVGGCAGSADMTCEHYLHTVAVFDKVLSDKDAADFLENHPFVFEDNLTALLDFTAGSADELVTGTEVYVDTDDLITAELSMAALRDKPYQYRINYSATVSAMKAWEGETTVEGVKTFLSEAFLIPTAVSAAALAALTVYIAKRPKILGAAAGLYTEKTVTSSGVVDTVSKIGKSAFKVCLKGLELAPLGAATMDSAVVMTAASAMFSQMSNICYAVLVGLGALAAVAAATAAIVQSLRKEKPDDDDKDAKLSFSSLSLQTAPDDYASSAIRCRDYEGAIKGEEWTSAGKLKKPAVYIADKLKRAKIKVKFRLKDDGTNGAHTVSLSAQVNKGTAKLFDNFTWEGSNLTVGKDYEAELVSGIDSSAPAAFAFEQITLWWSAKIDGKAVPLPNTSLEIYTIPTIPSPPIYLDGKNESLLLAVEYLKIATRMIGQKKSNSDSAQTPAGGKTAGAVYDDLKRLTMDIFASQCFHYVPLPNPLYTCSSPIYDGGIPSRVLYFNEARFLQDMDAYKADGPTVPIQIECEVYAAILCCLFRAKGIDASLKLILNPLRDANNHSRMLETESIYIAGSFEGPEDHSFDYHVIVEAQVPGIDPSKTEPFFFDASLGVMQNGHIEPVAGVKFCRLAQETVDRVRESGTYRGMVFKHNTGAILPPNTIVFVPIAKNWPFTKYCERIK